MSISNIQTLSLNPHYFSMLIQSFLTGYARECEFNLALFVIPILQYKNTRNVLKTANAKSRIDTIFASNNHIGKTEISGASKFAGFFERVAYFESYSKEAIIILFNEKKIEIKKSKILLRQELDYKKCIGGDKEDPIKIWLRSAYYLGQIFSKSSKFDIISFLRG